MPSFVLIQYVLHAALKDRVLLSVILMMIVGVALSLFMGSSAIIEQDQFAVVYTSSALRLFGLIGLTLFIVFYMRRSHETRDLDFLLSRPISRISFLTSHALAFSALGFVIAAIISGVMLSVSFKAGIGLGILMWCFGLLAEYIMISFVALFFANVLSSPVAAGLSTLGFYILSRMIGQILGIMAHPSFNLPVFEMLAKAMNLISMFIPRLDLLLQSSWLVYGLEGDIMPQLLGVFAQMVVFSGLILSAAIVDLARRQF